MDASVDTLVYQLEDEDPHTRYETLQKLRKLAAVERAHFPVRNPRRFLQCVRRRLSDDTDDPRIAREALRLLVDVMPLLGDDVEQLHSSILPHLVPRLPAHPLIHNSEDHRAPDDAVDANQDVLLHEDTFQVFRRYVIITSDLGGVIDVLVNMGLAHRRGSVREATLVAIGRLLSERYSRRGARVDRHMFIALLQALVPALEDPSERVVVATEETVGRIRVLWGPENFNSALSFLSAEDKATLQAHESPIEAFARATAVDGPGPSGVSASQVLRLRASLDIGDSNRTDPGDSRLRFGFVPADIVDAIEAASGPSNAEWKQRTAAVERLYAAAKRLDPGVLQPHDSSVVALADLLLRLVRDSDVHVVKRGLQILRLVWIQLCALADHESDDASGSGSPAFLEVMARRIAAPLVETAATYTNASTTSDESPGNGDDDTLAPHVAALWTALSDSASRLSVSALSAALLCEPLVRHRRLQVREQAFLVWQSCVRVALTAGRSFKGILSSPVLRGLGRGLGDGSSRVRKAAIEATATLQQAVCDEDVGERLEAELEDHEIDRVDWEAVHARLRWRPETRDATLMRLRTESTLVLPKSENERETERQLRRRVPQRIREDELETPQSQSQAQSKSPGPSRREPACVARDVTSAPSEPIADKLLCLKSKTAKLQKAATTRQLPVVAAEIHGARNPQEGDAAPTARLSQSQPQPRVQARVESSEAVATATIAPDERPIRPMKPTDVMDDETVAEPQQEPTAAPPRRRGPVPMSLATKKRLESKQRQEQEILTATLTATSAPVAPSEAPILDPTELAPVKDPKQEAARLLQRLRRESSTSDEDWERAVDALTTVRCLARHHSAVLQSHVPALVPAVLTHVPSLRSAVARAAMQAVEDVSCALGPALDPMIDTLLAVVLRRCADSNSFLSDSAAAAVRAVASHCSASRVASALAAQASSKAVAIRREVARAVHVVLTGVADPSTAAPSLLQLVGRSLEDPHNEVRDAAKQSILFLHTERRMDLNQLKRVLPASSHARLEQVLAAAPRANRPNVGVTKAGKDKDDSQVTAKRVQPALDAESVAALARKLDSAAWSDRVDALTETMRFVQRHSTALVTSGKALTLLDGIIARLEDGNAKLCWRR
ncbi:hypothetical protein ATCC90586_003631 [Pythium insidiosum]|nr:hypothetical protein ATCC90586_003631 [Pythium insidiosum]